MEDLFSKLTTGEASPSPIILPNIRYQFSKQHDGAGEVVAILLQIWLESLPVMQAVIPFDRLSFAHFVNAANGMVAVDPDDNGGIKAVE